MLLIKEQETIVTEQAEVQDMPKKWVAPSKVEFPFKVVQEADVKAGRIFPWLTMK